MSRRCLFVVTLGLLVSAPLTAGGQSLRARFGIGSPYDFGPYTGGHGYSYNVAYSYFFPFSSADTWRYDPLAYPAGISSKPWWSALRRTYPVAAPTYSAVVPAPGPALLPVPTNPAPATVQVIVPPGAEVWVEGRQAPPGGAERVFQTPPLTPGQRGQYAVRARWNEGGRTVEQFQMVEVQAGALARVTFPAPNP